MSLAAPLPAKSNRKQVLQQSNCNFDVSPEKDENQKSFLVKSKSEAENQFSPKKIPTDKNSKADAKKLRNIRLDLSSLKRGATQRTAATLKMENDFSSDESSEEESKKKRKMRPVVPNYVTNSDSGPCRKPRQSRQDPTMLSSQNTSKLAKPQLLSIARRNARERNRVKQVNEGFATLRSKIPDYISEAYNEEKGRKSAKKLSKVETLRMAVDYIRHLETLLDLRSAENEGWIKEIKTESQPWDTPNSSGDYPSPVESKFQSSPHGAFYDQTFEYQDRIFYDYDLDFLDRKETFVAEKRSFSLMPTNGTENENQCVEDFKYYESFNRFKKENSENETNDENLEDESRDSENLELSEGETEVHLTLKSKDVIKKLSKKTVLPSITESFNKGIAVFF